MTPDPAAVHRLDRLCLGPLTRGGALLALAGALAACSSPVSVTDEEPALEANALTTDRDAYTLVGVAGARVRFTFRNPRPETAWLTACAAQPVAVVQREEPGGWAQYAGSICPANLDMTPVPVAPGASREGDLWISEPGRYRLRVEYGAGVERIAHAATSRAVTVAR